MAQLRPTVQHLKLREFGGKAPSIGVIPFLLRQPQYETLSPETLRFSLPFVPYNWQAKHHHDFNWYAFFQAFCPLMHFMNTAYRIKSLSYLL